MARVKREGTFPVAVRIVNFGGAKGTGSKVCFCGSGELISPYCIVPSIAITYCWRMYKEDGRTVRVGMEEMMSLL